MLIATATTIDLKTSWTSLWNKISTTTGFSSVTNWIGIIGAGLVVFAIVKYILDRRKGQRGNHLSLIFTGIIGAIAAAPNAIIGDILAVVDNIVNLVLHAFGG